VVLKKKKEGGNGRGGTPSRGKKKGVRPSDLAAHGRSRKSRRKAKFSEAPRSQLSNRQGSGGGGDFQGILDRLSPMLLLHCFWDFVFSWSGSQEGGSVRKEE